MRVGYFAAHPKSLGFVASPNPSRPTRLPIKEIIMSTSLRLKTARLGAALALALAALPGTASAETFNAAGFNPSFAQSVVHDAGVFDDFFTFALNPAASIAAQGVSLNFAPFFNISGGSFQLYSGIVGSGSAIGGITPLNNVQASYGNLGAGNYYFNVVGNANGIAGGGYLFSMITTPVPEPGQMALLLSGLGLIGAMMRRRISSAA
jgi:hypothetical protein